MRTYFFGAFLCAALLSLTSPAAASDHSVCINPKRNSDPAAAVAACHRLIGSGKHSARDLAGIYTWLVLWNSMRRDLEAAARAGEAAFALLPTNSAICLMRGQPLIAIPDLDRAKRIIDECVRLFPKFAGNYTALGTIYIKRKAYDLAIEAFNKALRLGSKSSDAYNGLARSYREKNELDRALEYANKAIRIEPNYPINYVARANILSLKSKYARALADFEHAIKLQPKMLAPYIGRGAVWRGMGQHDRAIAEFGRMLKINPSAIWAYTRRGQTYESIGDRQRAISDYRKALNKKSNEFSNVSAIYFDENLDRARAIAKSRLHLLTEAPKTSPAPHPAPIGKHTTNKSATPAPADIGRRIALVVGNGAYQVGVPLRNPPNDAREVSKALRAMGFEVSDAIDFDGPHMKQAINEFLRDAAKAKIALLFYAGHGVQIDGKNYLLPIDVKLDSPGGFTTDMIDVDTVLAALDDNVRTNIVILDACRDNPVAQKVAQSVRSRSVKVHSGLAVQSGLNAGALRGAGTLIAFATAPGQVALDGDGDNSPFSTALARHISTPGIEVQQMLTRVRAEVVATTHGKQVPWSNSSLLGEVYLAAKP